MTNRPAEYYIGLMSGTSVDAVDAVLVDCSLPIPTLIASHNETITTELRDKILALFEPGDNEIERLGALDRNIARLFGTAVKTLLAKTTISHNQIIAIGSHGQTIRHRPDQQDAYTLQIGDPNTLAEHTNISVVADFRRRDIAAGGQGAPLVPAFHQCCFCHESESRLILNIGGIANVSLLSPDHELIGFDTGPGNGLMDFWIKHCKGLNYDDKGGWAKQGEVDEGLLQKWLNEPYFARQHPKSTGKEEFSREWLMHSLKQYQRTEQYQLADQDVQRTLLELSAQSMANAVTGIDQNTTVYTCGGGSHNSYLLERLGAHLGRTVNSTDHLGIPVDWVEAMAFAWLAYRRYQHLPGNTASVTGATGGRVLGAIYAA